MWYYPAMENLGEFEQLILFAVVQLGDDACGVEIREMIEERTGRQVSSGAIYTTLGRLEERGLVSSAVAAGAAGRPGRPRKAYALRPVGARALLDSYTTLEAMARGQMTKLAKLAKVDSR